MAILLDSGNLLGRGFEQCKEITRRYGTSYFFATQFFPNQLRLAIYAIYAFARLPDEIVDNPNVVDRQAAIAELSAWREKWRKAMKCGAGRDAVMTAIVHTFRKYKIPAEDGEAFLKSMFLDEEKFSYENYDELENYMYGSAGVIGLMITRIVGYSSDDAFEYAKKLGYAFQLTNFLRDIREDHEDLGRVYMPLDELRTFDLGPDDIANRVYDSRFIDFMKFQIARNREIYREALIGIPLLHWHGRLAVSISYVLYKAILREIERADYNIYNGRVRTSFRQKVWLSLKAVAGVYE